MTTKKAKSNPEVEVITIEQDTLIMRVMGRTPLICNAMSQKVIQGLLMPSGRKTAAEKAANMKHDVLQEFRDSIYRMRENEPTLIGLPATAFKGAMCNVATDLPGTAKAQIGRLTYVQGMHDDTYVHIYGVPQMLMSVTRSADIKQTPDVRTRAILPDWCCEIRVTYTTPLIKEQAVLNLMAAAGLIMGVGDWRPQKGKGDYGQFTLVGTDSKEWEAIQLIGGYDAQADALETPLFYDEETRRLYEWWEVEKKRRGFKGVS